MIKYNTWRIVSQIYIYKLIAAETYQGAWSNKLKEETLTFSKDQEELGVGGHLVIL